MEFLILIAVFGLMMWMMSRGAKKQRQAAQDLRAGLEVGQQVMTASGFYGTIVDIDGDVITLESTPGIETMWKRDAVASVTEPPFAVVDDGDLRHAEVQLHAQIDAVGFYQRHGFSGQGDEFVEAGIRHRLMRLQLAVPENDLIDPLNEEQRAAVLHFEGPALVLAGAGSGKTRTVVHRIAYLLRHHDVLPQQVLAVTFTNKAAGELKERVESLIGPPGRDLWVSTFHSACLRVLRTYGDRIDLKPGFGIYDDADQLDVLKDLLNATQGMVDVNPRTLRSLIDRAKSNLWTPAKLREEGEKAWGRIVSGLGNGVVNIVLAIIPAVLPIASSCPSRGV